MRWQRTKAALATLFLLLLVMIAPVKGAIINFTGAETGDTLEAPQTGTGATISTSHPRNGTYSYKSLPGSTTQTAYFAMSTATGALMSASDLYCLVPFYVVTFPGNASGEPIFAFLSTSGAMKLEIRLDSANKVSVYDSTAGSGTTGQIAVGTTSLSTGQYYVLGVHSSTNAGTSAYEVQINGVSELSGNAAQTGNGTGSVRWGRSSNRNSSSPIPEVYFDDIACDDAAYPTDGAVKVMKPDGAGNYTQWNGAGATGTTYTEVDELPNDGDTTIITADAQNDRFSVSLESTTTAGISASSVNYVKAISICERDGASNGTFRSFYRISSTDYDQASNSTSGSTGYIPGGYVRSTDPSDSGAWSTADLDALEIGVLDNHASNRTHCTALDAMVHYVASGGGGGGSGVPSAQMLIGVGR